MSDNDFYEWDQIMKSVEKAKEENPEFSKNIKNSKFFVDNQGKRRCSKCGSSDNINQCFDCLKE